MVGQSFDKCSPKNFLVVICLLNDVLVMFFSLFRDHGDRDHPDMIRSWIYIYISYWIYYILVMKVSKATMSVGFVAVTTLEFIFYWEMPIKLSVCSNK